MLEDDVPDSLPLLACGHRWNGIEAWDDMPVILAEDVEGQPACSTGHWCRLCRARRDIGERRLATVTEAYAWLRSVLP